MTLTDGTTTFNVESDAHFYADIEKASAKSAGGYWRTQIAGERLKCTESLRLTGAQYRALLDLIKNGAANYYYTPDITPPEYDDADFPISVYFDLSKKKEEAYNGSIIYYVDLDIESSEYI